ncbi:MAG: hypothetical protein GX974_07580 [Clostridiales bacterium]|nr:hypothetical protein [Clostridiales bacterium]
MDDRRDERNAYLIAMPAILLGLVLKIIPLLDAIKLPFMDFSLSAGTEGSPYVGFHNFARLFSTYYYRRLVSNTLILKLGSISLSALMAFLLGLSLSYIKQRKIRDIFIIFFTIPFFIPSSVFSYLMFKAFSTRWFVQSDKFRIVYMIVETLKKAGVFSIIIYSFIEYRDISKNSKLVIAIKGISIFLLVQLSSILTLDFETLSELINPLVYNVADTVDTYMYRIGIFEGDINQVTPIWFMKFIVQFPITVGIYYAMKNIYIQEYLDRYEHVQTCEESKESFYSKSLSMLMSLIYIAILCVPFVMIFMGIKGEPATLTVNENIINMDIISTGTRYLSLVFIAVLFNSILTLLLSYPLTMSYSVGQITYEMFLLILLVAGQGGVHEFMYYKRLGIEETIYPYMLNGLFSISHVIILAGIYNSKYSFSGIGRYLARQYKYIIAFAGFQFVKMWNSYYIGHDIYTKTGTIYSPIATFKSMIIEYVGQYSISVMKLGMIISIPPLVVGMLLCIFADRRVFIGRIRD